MAEVPVQVVSERDADGNSEARNTADSGYVAVSVSAAASEVLASIQVSLIAPICLALLVPCTGLVGECLRDSKAAQNVSTSGLTHHTMCSVASLLQSST